MMEDPPRLHPASYSIREGSFKRRDADKAAYRFIDLDLGFRGAELVEIDGRPELNRWHRLWDRQIQICISPAGRNVHINVDGVNITPETIERLKAEQERP